VSQLDRRTFLAGALAGRRRPNVVFVLVDQWRAQATGYNGDWNAHTPNIDRLARESVNFANAVSGSPVCSPYRASLMTGQYPLTHGVFINDVPLVPKGQTLAGAFSAAGYRTAYVGKWHLYGSPEGKFERRGAFVPRENRLGFDYWKAAECTHDYNRSLYYEHDDRTPRYWSGYDAIAQTADACDFVRNHGKGADPLFLLLSLGPPHDPYGTAPEAYRREYAEREIRLRPNVPEEQRETAIRNLRGYYAHIAALDDCVGKLLAEVDDDTIFVFASDHGDMLGCQGLRLKQHPWEESIRVPFLVRWPARLKPRVMRAQIDAPDIMPTLLTLAGIRVPDGVQGVDAMRVRPHALLNLAATFSVARGFGFAEYRGLRTEQHTYVRSIRGPWLLYDNLADPYQKHNLVARETALVRRLDAALERRLRGVGDDFLPGSRYLERAGLTHYREAQAKVGTFKSPWGDWESTM
jgi:arylsulfatase A-like enzyme